MNQLMFSTPSFQVHVATRSDHSALVQFCRDNPAYDVFLTGDLPEENEWVEDFLTEVPPAHFGWTATHKLIVTIPDDTANIVAVIDVTEDMIGKGVGHVGLFQVAQRLHGSGIAREVYNGLEQWLISRGTKVMRLGVLDGNARGMAFWNRLGYLPTRTRIATALTCKQQLTYVMYKPLLPTTLKQYRDLVPRDHPDAP